MWGHPKEFQKEFGKAIIEQWFLSSHCQCQKFPHMPDRPFSTSDVSFWGTTHGHNAVFHPKP
jgi:hypothetical protein